jgi:tetratricopeptide (TPR) repeat protein
VRQRQALPKALDARADIYSLGRMLVELLDGAEPARPNPQVSPGLRAILTRCLAANPEARYPDAGALADDLGRHLDDQPLRGVTVPSWRERWRKWRRRKPAALSALFLMAFVVLSWLLYLVYDRVQTAKALLALQEGQKQLRGQHFDEAVGTLRHGLDLTGGLFFRGQLCEQLQGELRQAERAQAVQELQRFTEQMRILCSAELLPSRQARAAEGLCQTFWQQRQRLAERLGPPGSTEGAQARADLLDLAILWRQLRYRLAGSDRPAVLRETLEVLGQAEQLGGPSCVLQQERLSCARLLGLADLAGEAERRLAALKPTTAWEYLALGRALFPTDLDRAEAHLSQALQLQPGLLWAQFYQGKCAFQRGRFEDALPAFHACVALAPDQAWCYCNRGLVLDRLGKPENARADYDQALRLQPDLTEAALNRGLLHYRQGRLPEALADLQRVLQQQPDHVEARRLLAEIRP